MSVIITDSLGGATETPIASPWVKGLSAGGSFNRGALGTSPANLANDMFWLYSGLTVPNDQYAQVKVTAPATSTSQTGGGVVLRASTASGGSGVWVVVNSGSTTSNVAVAEWVAGSYTLLAQYNTTWVDTTVLYVSIVGTTVTVKQGGSGGSTLGTTTTSIASGIGGIAYSSSTTSCLLTDWEIGDFSTGTTIAVPAGSLAITGQAPTRITTESISPGVGSMALAGFAPAASINSTAVTVSPNVGSLALTGLAPTASLAGVSISPGAGSLAVTGYAPGIGFDGPPTGALTLTGFAPTVINGLSPNIIPGVGALALTCFAPSLRYDLVAAVPAATMTLNGFAPTTETRAPAVPGTGTLTLTGFRPRAINSGTTSTGVSGGNFRYLYRLPDHPEG